ncbi:MAG: hypothetical protein KF705_15185 [Phycisphaeraceae bacterium]|nr:hypothetical protein [Phycisphaeraceae bacterium]
MFDNASRLWVIHISNHAKIANRAQTEGFVCIGWTRIGNLAPHDTREKMKSAMCRAFPDWSTGSVNSSYGQVFRFAQEMQVGDPIVYPVKGSREIMIGQIAGSYRWAGDDRELVDNDYCNVRPVKWLKTVPRIAFSDAALHSFGSFSSVSTSDEYLEEVIAVLSKEAGVLAPTVTGRVAPTKSQYGSDLPISSGASPISSPSPELAIAPADTFNLAERAIE